MSNFAQRLHNVANSPHDRIPNNTPLDPFHDFGNQDLSNLINAAANALRSRVSAATTVRIPSKPNASQTIYDHTTTASKKSSLSITR
jgi:hypothetical protein